MTDSNIVERLARLLCLRAGHESPDIVVVAAERYAVTGRPALYVRPIGEPAPLWQLWSGLAADLVDSVGEAAAEQYAEAVETGDAKAIAATKLARVIKEAFAS